MKKRVKKISADEFDKKFEEGKEDITPYLDLKKAKVDVPVHRINIDIPAGLLAKVDQEAERVGIPRTSLLKVWIAEHVDRLAG